MLLRGDDTRQWRAALVATCVAAGAAYVALPRLLRILMTVMDPHDGLDSAVSETSRSIAALRALEAEQKDPLFVDPLAAALAGRRAIERVRSKLSAGGRRGVGMQDRIAVRTKFFDDALLAGLAALPGAQVVSLGTGLDSRAWRMRPAADSPRASAWFEVDQPDVLRAKSAALAVSGQPPPLTLAQRVAPVSYDFHRLIDDPHSLAAALQAAGFDEATPTLWLAEGLLYYLSPAAVGALLRAAAAMSAPGSRLMASAVNQPALARARASGSKARQAWAWATDRPEADFAAEGWTCTLVARPGDPACAYGRCARPAEPRSEAGDAASPATWYLTAQRK